jgi:hypothetical protein
LIQTGVGNGAWRACQQIRVSADLVQAGPAGILQATDVSRRARRRFPFVYHVIPPVIPYCMGLLRFLSAFLRRLLNTLKSEADTCSLSRQRVPAPA